MRHLLGSLALVGVVASACAHNQAYDRDMQPELGRGYTLETTGAVIGRDDPSATDPDVSIDTVATRLAAQICDREVRCHANGRSIDDCRRQNLDRARVELHAWRCSPAAIRARAEECLASVGSEPCDLDLASRASFCGTNAACASDDFASARGRARR